MNRTINAVLSIFFLLTSVLLYSSQPVFANALSIKETIVRGHDIILKGTTTIPHEASAYIQYYVGKEYSGTLTNCIYSSGFHAEENGAFELTLPAANLKGPGTYRIVLEQNPLSNKIIPPENWMAFRKEGGRIIFGDISAMGEIENLALTVGMETAAATIVSGDQDTTAPIHIRQARIFEDRIVITGHSDIHPDTSSYLQYYVGKIYDGTLSTCIFCDGFHTDKEGGFTLDIAIADLRGNGRYEIVLEQNPSSNAILPPKHWIAFRKSAEGILFGDITSMGEIENLALTVGMAIAKTEILVGNVHTATPKIIIAGINQVGDQVIVKGNSKIGYSNSNFIQYYIGKRYPDTLTNCILSDGVTVAPDGSFELSIPVSSLRGPGNYEIALEQNPVGNIILPPSHWIAFRKSEKGIVFGDISTMGEIANLALTVGMELSRTTFLVK